MEQIVEIKDVTKKVIKKKTKIKIESAWKKQKRDRILASSYFFSPCGGGRLVRRIGSNTYDD